MNFKINSISKGKYNVSYIHGFNGTSFYNVWHGIKNRCLNKNNPSYERYGGRGIINEWSSFLEFKNDMYKSYLKHKKNNTSTMIERINNDGNYCKENCRWSTITEQNRNKPGVTLLKIDGEIKGLKGWGKHFGIKKSTAEYRVKAGWGFHRALNLPLSKTIKLVKNYYLG